jgi:hypothetical protein
MSEKVSGTFSVRSTLHHNDNAPDHRSGDQTMRLAPVK